MRLSWLLLALALAAGAGALACRPTRPCRRTQRRASTGPAVIVSGFGGRRRAAVARSGRVQGFCEELASELAAGLPVPAALTAAGQRWPELRAVAVAQALGGSVPDALRVAAEQPGAGDLRLVAAAWQVAERSGAALAPALESVVASLEQRRRTRAVVTSELASARATARLMAALPVFTLAMGSGAGGDPVGFLLGTPTALACLAGGLALAGLGLWWIERVAVGVERGT